MGLLDSVIGSVLNQMGGGSQTGRANSGPLGDLLGGGALGSVLGGALGGALGGRNAGNGGNDGMGSLGKGALGGIGAALLVQVLTSLLQQNGGLGGLLDKLRNGGMGSEADSWVGRGSNMQISPNQLQAALGDQSVAQMAQQTGLDSSTLLESLSAYLPEIINQLTPDGRVPDGFPDDLLGRGR